jgi:hypothetical protein
MFNALSIYTIFLEKNKGASKLEVIRFDQLSAEISIYIQCNYKISKKF